jgi:hypothetical protein
VITNFYSGIIWDIDQPGADLSYNFKTFLRREMMHMLGFESHIPFFVTPEVVDGTANISYTLYDKFLYESDSAAQPLINPDPPYGFNGDVGSPSPQVANGAVIFKVDDPLLTAYPLNHPVYAPDGYWHPGVQLRHFDQNRADSPYTKYVTHPSLTAGEDVPVHLHEMQALCMMGYNLPGLCDGVSPIPIDDMDIEVPAQESTCVNVVGNDYDLDGTPFWISSVETVVGADSVATTFSGGQICFTPNEYFQGNAVFHYYLTDGVNTSLVFATVVVNFSAGECLSDPGNFVCNGGFELGSENCSPVDNGSLINDWHQLNQTPDYFTLGACVNDWSWDSIETNEDLLPYDNGGENENFLSLQYWGTSSRDAVWTELRGILSAMEDLK